jgi:MiaB/RimO family radical SAM methylthiotransferase
LFTKKACVLCNGCPESRIDSSVVQNFLIENGWTLTDKVEEADLVLFRACGLVNNAVDNSLRIIKKLDAQKKENAKFIVWGCLPKIDKEALRSVYSGITFGEDEVNIFDKILEAKKPIAEVTANYCVPRFEFKPPAWNVSLERFLTKKFNIVVSEREFIIKASTGCLGNCSYCNVRKSRGLVHSKTIEEVVTEFRNGLKKGFRHLSLLGTDLGAYGRDLGYNLADLLVEMTKEKGEYKIGLRNVNPYYLIEMFEELRPIFARGKISFLLTAAQSGSDRILKLMRRRYKIQDFIRCIKVVNNEYPNIILRSQIMVGFPTETEEDFQMSMRLSDELKFDWVEIYKFSPNKGTLAATMMDQVPEHIKEIRYKQLRTKNNLQSPHLRVRAPAKFKKIFS